MQHEDLNRAYEAEVADVTFYCRKGCSSCCTRTVNMTTAEGARILSYLEENCKELPDFDPLLDIPTQLSTTNNAAACYLDEKLPPEGSDKPWNFLPCLFLENEVCTIYPVRPFGCRSFGSLKNCRETQSAEAPEWFVSLNLFIMQILEHIDRKGYWGNMFEVLAFLRNFRDSRKLLKTENIPGFLVPEGDRLRVMSYLARLRAIVGDDEELKEIYTILRRSITNGKVKS